MTAILLKIIFYFDRFIDGAKHAFNTSFDIIHETIKDISWFLFEYILWNLGLMILFFVKIVFNVFSTFLKVPKYLIVPHMFLFVFSIVQFLFVQIVVNTLYSLGSIWGLRTGRDYSVTENLMIWIPIVGIFLCGPLFLLNYEYIEFLNYFLAFGLICLGLYIIVGITGQVSLGHGAFVLMGGYFSAIAFQNLPTNSIYFPVLIIILSGTLAGLIGFPLGFPAVRVRGPYLSLITLGLVLSMSSLINSSRIEHITGGPDGLFYDIEVPSALESIFNFEQWIFINSYTICAFSIYLLHLFINRTKYGRAFKLIRNAEEKCLVLGINVGFNKALAFSLSAALAGMGGSILCMITGFIGPESYGLKDSLDYLVAISIGGLQSFLGALFGGLFMAIQPSFSEIVVSIFGQNGIQLLWFFYGLFVIFVVTLFPKGIVGEIQRRLRKSMNHLPNRRHARRNFSPDYDYDEEFITSSFYNVKDVKSKEGRVQ